MTERTRKRIRACSGLAAVEAALALPVLLVLVLGVVETGNMLYSWLTVHKAAQAGARFAATGQGDEDGSRLALVELAAGRVLERLDGAASVSVGSWPGLPAAGEPVAGDPGPPCGLVQVSVVYPYHPVTPLVGALLPEVVHLSGSGRKLVEPYRPCE